MRKKEWKKVNEILKEVLALEASERQDYYEDNRIEEDLREEVESLLSFEDEAESSMNLAAVEFAMDFSKSVENTLVGQQIGAYKIIDELGDGGMGAVYLAERTDGEYTQRVALKLLKREMNTSALRRRFQVEREILASLEHPNIARLLNAGTTKDKIPYIAMEYVKGLPIDEYCKKYQLSLSKRLDIFTKVCSAVDFAHRNLVVHRDLKPSNIFVTEDGTPKLLDFGISKTLSNDLDKTNSATVTKMGMMTPSYASPEQLQSKSVTTATDIYSLGVVLYELLSGHRPFEEKEKEMKEIFKAVIETDPPLPSVIAETFSGIRTKEKHLKDKAKIAELSEAKTIAEESAKINTEENKLELDTNKGSQNLEPETLLNSEVTQKNLNSKKSKSRNLLADNIKPQYLRGDLDNIILKALKKEPERRYSSAEKFQDDIKRHQKGLPVNARPDTFSYRTSKFIKRNTLGVAAAGLILFAIVSGVFATLWQARIAQAERAKAENRFNDVRTLANSFLFEISPKIENLSGSIPARKLLVQRALEYLNSLSRESANDLELQRELASAYQKVGDLQGNPYNPNIGDIKGALESYEKALKIRKELLKNDSNNIDAKSDLATTLEVIGDIHFNGGDYDKSVTIYDRAIGLVEQFLEDKPEDFEVRTKLARLLKTRGIIPFSEGNNKEAIEYYGRSQKIYEQLNKEKPENYQTAQAFYSTYVSIGEAQGWDEDYVNAGKNLQIGLDLIKPLAEKHPNDQRLQRSLMLAYLKRAESYADVKNYKASEEAYLEAVNIAKIASGNDQENAQAKRDYAVVSKKLAETLDMAGKSKESLEYLKFALNLMQELSSKDPNNSELLYDVANNQLSVGETYLSLKNYDEALKVFLQAKKGFADVLKINPENIYAVRANAFNSESLGKAYEALANNGNRQELLKKAVENYKGGLNGLKKLKSEGKLSNEDFESVSQMEKEIEQAKSKLSK